MSNLAQKKLYLAPKEGMIKGVCAGLAHYLGVPVALIRVMAVLSIFFGLLMFTLVAYIILSFSLDPVPDEHIYSEDSPPSPKHLLAQADAELKASEQRLRQIERYVTSETFGVRSRFRQL